MEFGLYQTTTQKNSLSCDATITDCRRLGWSYDDYELLVAMHHGIAAFMDPIQPRIFTNSLDGTPIFTIFT